MIHILYRDDACVVCVKPRGILSEGQALDSLPARLEEELGVPVYPVHRLDRQTEGLMVLALSSSAAAALSRGIAAGELEKEYLAVVCGAPKEGKGELTDLLFYDRRAGKSFVATRPRKGVKEARLDYTLQEKRERHALLLVRLHTGRTHQIRAQFASRGLPLVGDRRYGAPAEGLPLALYSHFLSFPHPLTGQRIAFRATPAPQEGTAWAEFSDFLAALN